MMALVFSVCIVSRIASCGATHANTQIAASNLVLERPWDMFLLVRGIVSRI